jgi:hypothetical protein
LEVPKNGQRGGEIEGERVQKLGRVHGEIFGIGIKMLCCTHISRT